MTPHFNTNEYEFSHGKKPRGHGYWAFFFDGNYSEKPFLFSATTRPRSRRLSPRPRSAARATSTWVLEAPTFSPNRTEPDMADPENLILRQLDLVRRELAAMREASELFAKRTGRLLEESGKMRNDIAEMRNDIHTLENQNLNRHNEILGILERLTRVGA